MQHFITDVLVIDDSAMTRMMIKAHIQHIDSIEAKITEASTGMEAISRMKDSIPSVILLDYMLPDCTGIEVLQAIRRDHPFIPVIMVTSYGDVQLVVESLTLGAQGYLLKDQLTAETLLWAMTDALNKAGLQKLLHEK